LEGPHVDHEIAEGRAGAHHDAGGEHVEDELGGGASLHAGAAGEDFRAGGGGDGDVCSESQGGVGNAAEADGESAEIFGVVDGTEDVGRAAAGGDSYEGVGSSVSGKACGGEVARAFFAGVFGVLAGEAEGAITSGDEALDEVGGDGKSWGALAGVEDAEAAAGACTDVEEAATAVEAFGDGVDGAGDAGEFGADGCGDGGVFRIDEGEHVEGGELIEMLGGRIAGLGEERGERVSIGCWHGVSVDLYDSGSRLHDSGTKLHDGERRLAALQLCQHRRNMDEADQQETRATIAWQSRDFRFYSAARLVGIVGAEAQAVGVAWQVYQITHSALALGYTGLALFLPGIFFVLPAGHVADRYDRRTIILICYAVQALATVALLRLALDGTQNIWLIYAILFLIGMGRCFSGPASSALVPTLVPKGHFVNAVTWGATIFQIANATGPMIGGLLFTVSLTHLFGGRFASFNGAPLVYCFTLVGLLLFLLFLSAVKPRGGGEKKDITVETMLAGLRYVLGTRLLLGSISLDLFAVLLGGAASLMPIFAVDILHSGANGLGLLRAMPSLGALAVSLTLLVMPIKRRAGKTMLTCVGMFGAATVVFGLSRNILLSCAALVVIGATDMISVVVRSSILQLATPPEMRGRVSSISWLFVGASNELGEYESGLTAHWWGAVRAVVIGGVASLAVTGVWSVFFPALRHADRLTADSLTAVEQQFSGMEPID